MSSRIEDFYNKDKFALMIGAVVEEASDQGVVCSLKLGPDHLNAGGTVQGGVVFTLADFAFAIACNMEDVEAGNQAITINQSSSIIFLRPAKGDRLIARTTRLQKGRKISVYRISVTDNAGVDVAEMTGNGYRVVK